MAPARQMSLRQNVAMFAAILVIMVGGAWLAIRMTTDHLLYNNATSTARHWAHYVAESVTDLEQIAAGEVPSEASMTFFRGALKAQRVFRYEIYNRHGYSLLVSDHDKIGLVDISGFSAEAVRSIETGEPVVNVSGDPLEHFPAFFSRAYVPVFADGHAIAVVAAYVDQTRERDDYRSTFVIAAGALCLMTAFGFAIPAIAWYRRSKEKLRGDRRIHYLAHHDVLTGLMNRTRVMERLSIALSETRPSGIQFAVHYLDVDRFKTINDTLGHDSGDALLRVIAERLKDTVRTEDSVARLGGDEFVIIQADIKGKDDVQSFADRVAAALSCPVPLGEHEILPTISIGVALAPTDGQTPERLLKSADLALYSSKAEGRACVRFFTPEMDAAMQERLALERIIRDATAKNGFELNYQPVFGVAGRELSGFEALIRLRGPDGESIPPIVFIPVAEEIRLIDKIGAWVLREACREAAQWPENLTVAVNLSAAQFGSGNISSIVSDALNASGLNPRRLELEITETLLLGDSDTIIRELKALKQIGVAIVMDDFGTGYSSLSYLWRFPFDKIKIDRSFMAGFGETDRDASTVVKTIIALGRELNMRVTVEGVETEEQVAFLDCSHADLVQGYFFGRPIPSTEVARTILTKLQESRERRQGGRIGSAPQAEAAA
jgi:diguanylate cyclase (GGDEF)-like protein